MLRVQWHTSGGRSTSNRWSRWADYEGQQTCDRVAAAGGASMAGGACAAGGVCAVGEVCTVGGARAIGGVMGRARGADM